MSFKLPVSWEQLRSGDVGEMDAEEARLLAKIFLPIPAETANLRQRAFVRGEKQSFRQGDHTYMCKMWDGETRRCKIYKFRPPGCKTFPYGSPCRYGCSCMGKKPGPEVII